MSEKQKAVLDDATFRALLNAGMKAPWTIEHGDWLVIRKFLDIEALARGYASWDEAFRKFATQAA